MIRNILLSLGIPAAAAATVVPVAAVTGEFVVAASFFVATALLAAVVASARRWLPTASDVATPTLLALVAASWTIVVAAAGLITWTTVHLAPSSGGAPQLDDPVSALFEAVSGLSTTGLSMIDDASAAEPWLQWWRSVLQWVGAIGVVLFAATVAEPSGDHDTLVGSEWGDSPGDSAIQTARRLGLILSVITLASIGAMVAVGEPLWRAVNQGMTAASTAGFSVASGSAADSTWPVRTIIAVTLLVAAMSFGTLWDRAVRAGVPLWKRTQVRFGLGLTALCVGAALVVSDGVALGDVAFNAISASTTGGFSAGTSYRSIEALAAIAMVSMFVGGAAGSTAGGIKAARLAWLVKAAARWLPGEERHGDEEVYLWDGESVDAATARHRIMGSASIVVTWLAIVAIATVVLAVHNPIVPASDSLFEAFSAASGVGLSSGITSGSQDAATKLTLSALMLAGRVEMTAFVVLFIYPMIPSIRSGDDAS